MHINCIKCGTATSIENTFEVKFFGCPNCNNLFTFQRDLSLKKQFNYKPVNPVLEIGKKGIFDGIEYEIISRFYKNFHKNYFWREYTLKSKRGNYLYLSESDGHWILLEEIEEKFKYNGRTSIIRHNDIPYNLYEYTNCRIVGAAGFFDEKVSDDNIHIAEFINPPNIISIEKYENKETSYFGRHITKSEVKRAFGSANLPSKSGVGAIQPFLFNFYNTAIIFCVVAILILVTQIFVNQNRTPTEVLSREFEFSEYDKKDFVSESFTLKGGSAPMTISVRSNVENSWANAQIALINENTNEEIYANKDIEYYSGYTDGESWSEGSQRGEFDICGVGEGKYHLVITPQKQPDDVTNNSLYVKVVWKEPSLWNFGISILVMGIIIVILFLANKNFEQRRWENSDYSPI